MKDYKIGLVPLKEIHKELFKLLVEFDRICVKYEINYSLEGGTLLGAVKYQGFVPWDDDLDVVMLREDYDKFLSVAKSELNSEFFLQNVETEKDFPLNYSKLRLNDSSYVQINYEFLDIHHGLFLDIFPLDFASEKKYTKKFRKLGALNGAKLIKLKLMNSSVMQRHKISKLKLTLYKGISLLSLKTLNKKIQKSLRGKKSGVVYNYCSPSYNIKPMPISRFSSYTKLKFMGRDFSVVSDYDNWLKETFGKDYMVIEPNANTRRPSHAIKECRLKTNKSAKKVGVLTFHQANNYGALLQAYALTHAIKKLAYENGKDIDCEIIDYENKAIKQRYEVKPFYKYKKTTTKIKKLFINGYVKKNNSYFDLFRKTCLPLSKKTYYKENLESSNEVYDIFITGSDQVFNYRLTDNDTAYYLDFVNNKNKKIGYAVSVGNNQILLNSSEENKRYLERFDAMSARETDLYKLFIEKGFKDTVQVLDPSFLLDANDYICNKLPYGNKKIDKKFVLVYVIGSPFNDKLYDFTKKIADELDAEIVYINTDKLQYKGVINLRYVPISSFLWLIKNATCVITTSFHGFAYSLIYNTNVYYKLASGEGNFNSRFLTLAEHFDLSSRNIDECISKGEGYSDIKWDKVNQKIQELKEKSLNFLKENIIDERKG